MRKVVVTGRGVVSAAGNSVEEFRKGIHRDPAPFRRLTRFDIAPLDELYAAEVVDFEPPVPVKPKQPWSANRGIQFAIAAAQQALAEAGIAVDDANRTSIGVVFGSTHACLDMTVKLDFNWFRQIQGRRDSGSRYAWPDDGQWPKQCAQKLGILNPFNKKRVGRFCW